MPTVKTPAGPTVAPVALQGQAWSTAVPEGAFDNGAKGLIQGGKDIMKASDRLDEVVLAQAEKDAKTQALDTRLQAKDEIRQLQQDFMSRKMSAADGTYDDAKAKAEEVYNKYADKLTSPRSKELFKALYESDRDTFLNGMSNHQRMEMDKAHLGTITASVEDARRSASENYKTPGAFEESKQQIEVMLHQLYPAAPNKEGVDANAAMRNNALREEISKTRSAVITRMLVNDPPLVAKQYFDANKKDFVGEDLAKVEAHMKPYLELAQVHEVLDSTKGQPLSARMAAIKKMEDEGKISPQVRDKAEEKAKGDYHLAISMAHEADYQYGKTLNDTMVKRFQAGDIAGAEKLALTAGRGMALHAQQLVTQMKAGQLTATDPKVEWELTQLAANDPAGFRAAWNPLKYGTQLNAKDVNKFDSLYLSIGKGEDKVIDDIRTDAARVAEAAVALGIENVHKASDEEKTKMGLFARAFQGEVDQHIQKTGKKPTPQEKDAMVDRLLLKGQVKGSGWFGSNFRPDTGFVFEGNKSLSVQEPKRPDGLPSTATWDGSRQGWIMNGKLFPYRQGVK